jgi:hypothetical protein
MADFLALNRFLIFLIDGGFLCFSNSALATHSPKPGLIFRRESSDSASLGVFIRQILFCDKHSLELLVCGNLFCSALDFLLLLHSLEKSNQLRSCDNCDMAWRSNSTGLLRTVMD